MNVKTRVKRAVESGVKIKTIADMTGVSYFRLSSIVSPDKYRGETNLSEIEAAQINKALDDIKATF